MQIEINEKLFYSDFDNLLKVISKIDDIGRHQFYVDIAKVAETENYKKLYQTWKLILEKQYEQSAYSSKSIYSITIEPQGPYELTVEEGIQFLQSNSIIVLENSLYDGIYLESCLKAFTKKGKKIQKHLDKDWTTIVNAGGKGNICNVIKASLKRFSALPKENNFYLKCFVLMDSDAKYVNDKSNCGDLEAQLNSMKIPYHIFEKKELENYIDPAQLGSLAGVNEEFLTFYQGLNPIQKDYFSTHKGFDNKPFSKLDPMVQRLYSDIEGELYKKIRNLKIGVKNFKSESVKLFIHHSAKDFEKRIKHTNKNEHIQILEKISKHI